MAKRTSQPKPPAAGKDAAQPAGSIQDGAPAPAESAGVAAAAAAPSDLTASELPLSGGTPAEDGAGTGQDALLNTAAPAATPETPTPAAPTQPQPYPDGVVIGADPLAKALAELEDDGEVEGLWITAIPEEGFRRCGYRFTREGFGIALTALTYGQIEQLVNEPMLKVEQGMFSGLVV
jgi:hypothetical protein